LQQEFQLASCCGRDFALVRENRVLKRISTGTCSRDWKAFYRCSDELLCILGIFLEIVNDFSDRDGVVRWVPAVIVRDERHSRVTDLGFTSQLRFLKVGHTN